MANPFTGVLISKSSSGFDCSNATALSGFIINAFQPDNSEIFFAFNSGDSWFSLSNTGYAQNFMTDNPSFEDLKTYGNTPETLNSINDIPAFVGKFIRIAIGLSSEALANPPAVNISVKSHVSTQTLSTTITSPLYDLGADGYILSVNDSYSATGTASVSILGKFITAQGYASDWRTLPNLQGVSAQYLQLKAIMSVGSLHTGLANLYDADIIYSDGFYANSGSNPAEIISTSLNWFNDIHIARVSVSHSILDLADISCAASVRISPTIVRNELLGYGSGQPQSFKLSHFNGLLPDSITLYANGLKLSTPFTLDALTGKITATLKKGAAITCDYQYGWDFEQWTNMILSKRTTLLNYQVSEFYIIFPQHDNPYSVASVKISLIPKNGSANREFIGEATGYNTTYKLAHPVRNGTITIYANNDILPKANYSLLHDTQFINIAAPAGNKLYASYSWTSELTEIKNFKAVFSD